MELIFSRTHGQEVAKNFLQKPLVSGSFHHAWLIHGAPGVGQEALILDIRDILACTDTQKKPCGKCAGCKARTKGLAGHLTMLPYKDSESKSREDRQNNIREKASAIEEKPYEMVIENRDQITLGQVHDIHEALSMASVTGTVRVISIYMPERMAVVAANAMLKLMEEPPQGVFFLMACSDKNSVLPTIRSRALPLGLLPLTSEEMLKVPGIEKGNPWINLVQGSPGRLFQLQKKEEQFPPELFEQFFGIVDRDDFISMHDFAGSMGGEKKGWDWVAFIEIALEMARQQMRSRIIAEGENTHTSASGLLPTDLVWEKRRSYLERAIKAIRGYAQAPLALSGLLGWQERHAW